jgi:hypothetical protein
MEKTLKDCNVCGSVMLKKPERSWYTYNLKKYCSRECSHIGSNKQIKKKCEHCDIEFSLPPSHISKINAVTGVSYERKYCSKKCFHEHTFNKVETKCCYCNMDITKHGYVYKGNDKCYCSKKCSDLGKRKNNGQNQGRRSPEDLAWKKGILELFGNTCQNCDSHLRLEAHHIKPILIYPHLRHELSNGICLCHNCHYYGVHNGQPNFKHGKYVGKSKKHNIVVSLKKSLEYLKDELKS